MANAVEYRSIVGKINYNHFKEFLGKEAFAQFEHNVKTLNKKKEGEDWLRKWEKGINTFGRDGLKGAFVWSNSEEGYDYWYRVSCDWEKVCDGVGSDFLTVGDLWKEFRGYLHKDELSPEEKKRMESLEESIGKYLD